ncbi:MAG: hypothetical protein K9M57_10010, partial [Phycisphaerae bacterium]|nr:hypothetical protein [Phycisphaerae bacterium]
MLLTATAVAFNAAFISYTVNTNMADMNMAARNSLHQMCATIRMAANDPATTTITVSADGKQCTMVNQEGQTVIYKYDSTQRNLQVNINGSNDWYVMVDSVSPHSRIQPIFTAYAPLNSELPTGTIGKVDIRFRVTSPDFSKNFIASAIPRNVIYTY